MGQSESKDLVDVDVTGLRGPSKGLLCNTCLTRIKTETTGLIYDGEMYLCQTCFEGYENNIIVGGEDLFGVREMLVDALRNEADRVVKFDTKTPCFKDRIDVKCQLDRHNCRITGMCVYEDRWLVLCDQRNCCIKILKQDTYELTRYISFKKEPWDVTTIEFEDKLQMPRSGKNKYLICVTLPDCKSIWCIDLTEKDAIKTMVVKCDRKCYSITSSDNKIYTACTDVSSLRLSFWFIYMYNTIGTLLRIVYLTSLLSWEDTLYVPRIAVSGDRIYITGYWNDVVQCINEESDIIAHTILQYSQPNGVAVASNTHIYITAVKLDKIYQCSWDLRSYEELSVGEGVLEDTYSIIFNKGKLFVSHDMESPLRNCVTIIQHL